MTVNVNGNRIRRLRLERSWSQEKLAEHAGVSLRTIQRMEVEGVSSLHSRRAVANALAVAIPDLDAPSAKASAVATSAHIRPQSAGVAASEAPRSTRGKRRMATVSAAILALAIVAGASYQLAHRSNSSLSDDGQLVATIAYGNVAGPVPRRATLWPGKVDHVVFDAVGGPLELYVNIGDRVEQNQPLGALAEAQVTAPASGTVVSLDPESGAVSNGIQTSPLSLEIASFDTMKTEIELFETDLRAIAVGTDAHFTVTQRNQPAGEERQWSGNLTQILPTAATRDGKAIYTGYFSVDNADRFLRTGITVQVFFEIAAIENVITVPVSALDTSAYSDGSRRANVDVVLPDGGTETRIIHFGAMDDVHAEVLRGLKAGERVAMPAI